MALFFSLLYQVVIFFTFTAIQLPTAVFKRKPTTTKSKRNEDTTLNTETNKTPQPTLSKGNSYINYVANLHSQPLSGLHFLHC